VTRAVCFRCDWEGEAAGSGCPRCAAPLYRPPDPLAKPPPPAARPKPASIPPATLRPVEESPSLDLSAERLSERRADRHAVRHPRRTVAIAVAVAVLAGVLWWRDSSRKAPALADLRLAGTLVYASYDRSGLNERLFLLDLKTGRLRQGPLVRPITDLVASRAGPGWLGLLAGGYAYVLQGTSPSSPPVLLGVGDRMAWGPGAETLVQQVVGRSANQDCPLAIISQTDVRLGGSQVLYEEPVCDGVQSVGLDQAGAVYLTLSAAAGSAVNLVGYKRLHLLLPGYGMLSVSPVGDMIVEPQVALAGQGLVPLTGASLYWRGRGGPIPIAGPRGHLEVEQVLTWAPDGEFAVVLGSLGGIRSLWTVEAGPGESRRRPTRIGPRLGPEPVIARGREGDPDATVAPDGTVYFTAEGHLFVYRHGKRSRVPLPTDAPEPAGPVAWLASAS